MLCVGCTTFVQKRGSDKGRDQTKWFLSGEVSEKTGDDSKSPLQTRLKKIHIFFFERKKNTISSKPNRWLALFDRGRHFAEGFFLPNPLQRCICAHTQPVPYRTMRAGRRYEIIQTHNSFRNTTNLDYKANLQPSALASTQTTLPTTTSTATTVTTTKTSENSDNIKQLNSNV